MASASNSIPDHSPKVTIAIPTLNREAYLRLAIDSALSQTYGEIEIVVSNNCSNDGTRAYLDSLHQPHIHVIHQTFFLSMVENWNVCVREASGDYFLLLSDDDVLLPDAVERLVAGYASRGKDETSVAIVYSGATLIDSLGHSLWNTPRSPAAEPALDLILGKFKDTRVVILCAVLFRKMDLANGFPRDFEIINDAAMWMTICTKYEVAIHIPDPLVLYRVHPKNLTKTATISLWVGEHHDLLNLVVSALKISPYCNETYIQLFYEAVQQARARYIKEIIITTMGHHRIKGLLEFVRHLGAFGSIGGVKHLYNGVFGLLLTERMKSRIRRIQGR